MKNSEKRFKFSVSFRIWSRNIDLDGLSKLVRGLISGRAEKEVEFAERIYNGVAYAALDLGKSENFSLYIENIAFIIDSIYNNEKMLFFLKTPHADSVIWISLFANNGVLDSVNYGITSEIKNAAKHLSVSIFVEDYTNLIKGNPKKKWIINMSSAR